MFFIPHGAWFRMVLWRSFALCVDPNFLPNLAPWLPFILAPNIAPYVTRFIDSRCIDDTRSFDDSEWVSEQQSISKYLPKWKRKSKWNNCAIQQLGLQGPKRFPLLCGCGIWKTNMSMAPQCKRWAKGSSVLTHYPAWARLCHLPPNMWTLRAAYLLSNRSSVWPDPWKSWMS